MYKYSTIAELIDMLDGYWERNDTYELRYEHDPKYDLLDVKLYKDGALVHHAVCDETFDIVSLFRDYCVGDAELYAFIAQAKDFEYRPLPGEGEYTTPGGDITLSERVLITDPCYDPGIWCNGELRGVRPGKWHTKVIARYSAWGEYRENDLIAWHESVEEPTFDQYEDSGISVGVDSGTAGIFDYDHYVKKYKDEEWRETMSFGTSDYDDCVKDKRNKLQERCYVEWQQVLKQLETIDDTRERHAHLSMHRYDLACKYGFDPGQFTHDGYVRRIHNRAYTDGHGVACTSGFGDGVYDCYVAKQDGEIVAIRLDFDVVGE